MILFCRSLIIYLSTVSNFSLWEIVRRQTICSYSCPNSVVIKAGIFKCGSLSNFGCLPLSKIQILLPPHENVNHFDWLKCDVKFFCCFFPHYNCDIEWERCCWFLSPAAVNGFVDSITSLLYPLLCLMSDFRILHLGYCQSVLFQILLFICSLMRCSFFLSLAERCSVM